MFIKLTREQCGFSLIEIMVALALTGFTLLVISNVMKDQSQNESFIKGKAEVSRTVSIIEATLKNKDACKRILQNKSPTSDLASLSYVNARGITVTLLETNKDYGAFRIAPPIAPVTSAIRLAPSGISNNIIDLFIDFTLKGRDQILTRKIPVVVSYDTTALIADCGALLGDATKAAEKQFCESLGALTTWDEPTQKCNVNNISCPAGQVVVRITETGTLICEDALARVNPEDLFETTPKDCTGKTNFRVIGVNGKITMDCY